MAANEQELARLIVRLIGDNSKYIQMLEQTKAKTTQATQEVKTESSKLAQRGAEIAREVARPQEKLKTKLLELNVLLKKGAIDQETYARAVRQTKDQLNGKNDIVGVLQGSMVSYTLRMIGFGAAMRQVSQFARQLWKDFLEVNKVMYEFEQSLSAVSRASSRLLSLEESLAARRLDVGQKFSPVDQLKTAEAELKIAERRVKLKQEDAKLTKAELNARYAFLAQEAKKGLRNDLLGKISRAFYGDPITDEIKNANEVATAATGAAMAQVDQLKDRIRRLQDELGVWATHQAPTMLAKAFSGGLKQSIEAWKEEQKEVKQIIEQSRTPIEVFNDEIDRLAYYLGKGAISMEVFEKASARAQMALQKTAEETKKAHMAMQAFDAASYRSAEARTRIEQHLTRNELDQGRGRTAVSAGLPAMAERTQEINILNRIANGVEKQARKPVTVITPSGVE